MFFRKRRLRRIELETGSIRFVVPKDDTTVEWSADLIILKLALEEIETRHNLKKNEDKTLNATVPFLEEVARVMKESHGCPACNVTIARQIWITISAQFNALEKRFRKQVHNATK